MTSAGANTWSVPLEINNLEAQVASGGGGGSGVTSLAAGAGISVSSGTGAVTVTNTGVTSLVAGSNITLSGGTGAVTISSTAGSSGVTQIIAGTNCTISPSGGTGAVTINLAPSVLPSGSTIDIYGVATTTITASQLAHCYIYSSGFLPTLIVSPFTTYNINLPSYSALLAQYGAQAVIPFTIGNFRTTTANIIFKGDSSIQIVANFNNGATGGHSVLEVLAPVSGTAGWTLINGGFWRGYCTLDPTNSLAYYSFNFQSIVVLT